MDVCNRDNVYLQLVNRQGSIGHGELYRLVPCCHIIMQKKYPYDIDMLLLNDGAKRNPLLYLKMMHTGVRKILCLHKILRQLFCLPFDAY